MTQPERSVFDMLGGTQHERMGALGAMTENLVRRVIEDSDLTDYLRQVTDAPARQYLEAFVRAVFGIGPAPRKRILRDHYWRILGHFLTTLDVWQVSDDVASAVFAGARALRGAGIEAL